MKKYEKEVEQAALDAEKKTIKALERQYQQALNDINERLAALMGRQDSDMQNVIFQVQYQQALRAQVQSVLEQLQAKEFETISQFMAESYQTGFIGTMYSMHQQGVPLVLPIDQKAMARAITNDTKLSEDLYTTLGVDVKKLNQSIRSEISRGIAANLSYNEIARNIANYARVPKSRANAIVRTEGHRIRQAASYDGQIKAKEKGADVLKQWDSVLDGDTRDTHRKLDGQIREIDEPFEVDGMEAMFPGDFGRPEEDCNCRCVSNTRARWALDEDELQRMQERAEYWGLDKTEDFSDFKNKYLNAEEAEKLENVKKNVENNGNNGIIKSDKPVDSNGNGASTNIYTASTATAAFSVDAVKAYEDAKNGTRHGGVYRDAMKKTKERLQKSIKSHEGQVAIHSDKIANPGKYDKDWDNKTQKEKDGLLNKWQKDMKRNAEQAAVEREAYRERFGEEP